MGGTRVMEVVLVVLVVVTIQDSNVQLLAWLSACLRLLDRGRVAAAFFSGKNRKQRPTQRD